MISEGNRKDYATHLPRRIPYNAWAFNEKDGDAVGQKAGGGATEYEPR